MNLEQEKITGLIERITFHNPENGFCVFKLKVKGQKDLTTVVGSAPLITPGEYAELTGTWAQNKQYGQQFQASHIILTPPTSASGMEKYLSSGLIKGVGPVSAKKLVAAFGNEVFEVIEQDPDLLQSTLKVSKKRAELILESFTEQKMVRTIMLFLHAHGISSTRALAIYKKYGDQAIAVIRQNPYRLAQDIRGFGFISADEIAAKLGIDKASPLRAEAGITYALTKAMDDGHCGLPVDELIASCQSLLSLELPLVQAALKQALEKEYVVYDLIGDLACVFLKHLYIYEKMIASRLTNLGKGPLPWGDVDFESIIATTELELNLKLSLNQTQALRQVLGHKISIITGGPGVGKTTILSFLLKALTSKQLKVSLCAPTGRAAKRMTEATSHEAKTIHRLLNVNPITGIFNFNEDNKLEADVVIIDETSMIDVPLMHSLLKAISKNTAVIFVGDKDQLPSVGPGQVLADFLSSKAIHTVYLTETYRQSGDSNIIKVAQQINSNALPNMSGFGPESDYFFLRCDDPELVLKTVVDLIQTRLPNRYGYSPFSEIQVICPMTRGTIGTRNLNTLIQKALNPPTADSIERHGVLYSVGDKVIQTENNYDKDIYNGDIGTIARIDHSDDIVVITFDERKIDYTFQELDEINLAYALTIHKSQGSEYPVIILPLVTQHLPMLQKRLVYTGITRGKKLVVVVGQPRALEIAISNRTERRRWSMLATHLGKQQLES